MKNQFDELAKGLAQSVTRRAALKKFGVGLAGMALAVLGLAHKAQADKPSISITCLSDADCPKNQVCQRMPTSIVGICVRKNGRPGGGVGP